MCISISLLLIPCPCFEIRKRKKKKKTHIQTQSKWGKLIKLDLELIKLDMVQTGIPMQQFCCHAYLW